MHSQAQHKQSIDKLNQLNGREPKKRGQGAASQLSDIGFGAGFGGTKLTTSVSQPKWSARTFASRLSSVRPSVLRRWIDDWPEFGAAIIGPPPLAARQSDAKVN